MSDTLTATEKPRLWDFPDRLSRRDCRLVKQALSNGWRIPADKWPGIEAKLMWLYSNGNTREQAAAREALTAAEVVALKTGGRTSSAVK